jgi:hypothetical protein
LSRKAKGANYNWSYKIKDRETSEGTRRWQGPPPVLSYLPLGYAAGANRLVDARRIQRCKEL